MLAARDVLAAGQLLQVVEVGAEVTGDLFGALVDHGHGHGEGRELDARELVGAVGWPEVMLVMIWPARSMTSSRKPSSSMPAFLISAVKPQWLMTWLGLAMISPPWNGL